MVEQRLARHIMLPDQGVLGAVAVLVEEWLYELLAEGLHHALNEAGMGGVMNDQIAKFRALLFREGVVERIQAAPQGVTPLCGDHLGIQHTNSSGGCGSASSTESLRCSKRSRSIFS